MGQQVGRRGLLSCLALGGNGIQLIEERRALLVALRERLPVHRRHHPGGHVLPQHLVECPESLLRGDPTRSDCLQLPGDAFPLLLGLSQS